MSNHVLFEIGIEELPARFIDDAELQFANKAKKWLNEQRISFESIHAYSTPRRLAILIRDIAEKQSTSIEEVKGPAMNIAKDKDGNWTKAAEGFTRGQGKTTDDIFVKDIKGTEYIFIEKKLEANDTIDLLPQFKEVIQSIHFPQTMHWSTGQFRYARPIRWLVALYNHQVIPFEIANVKTSNQTNGHRFLGQKITITDPLDYEKQLKDMFVIADKTKREQIILEGIKQLEQKEDFNIEVDPKLLNEVRNLVEYPTVFCGRFEEAFLKVPAEVLITSMKEHQRYFPVNDENENLLPYFIGVRNGDEHELATVIRGNEKVLHARLSDARFFYEEDLKKSIDFYQEKLIRLVYQEKLGTVSEKVQRVTKISEYLAIQLGVDEQTKKQAVRAAEISKFDLTTNMVIEFTELQGIIGEKYALAFGESKEVSKAIREHYLPDKANGELPESFIGSLLSIADKLDSVVGFLSVGLTPSGSQDPFSLRRQATGILRILQDKKWDIKLEDLFNVACDLFKVDDRQSLLEELHQFFLLRASYIFKEENIEQDIIEAVLHDEIGILAMAEKKAIILSEKRNDQDFKPIYEGLVRILNLAKPKEQGQINTELFETPSEHDLFEKVKDIENEYKDALNHLEADQALAKLSELADPIHHFFDHNMVMAEDEQVRKNRIALVNQVAELVYDYADLSLIQWKKTV